ncbi:hypothetical protein [Modestobacter versicolor]|uniref:Antibiotic biosynthesis monooxygenase n=1 Tax=Modestobacter versicolor TaxID=429133 RepID=A0A323V7C4_9ACTN|nr:hypothetical protein [Modestobacter versicolor]MBB3675909.1 hypothetical protein [Modestobacter versicolor]PZA20461.1 hypothetical protein DMO24_15320 [Modestobacter versicolor]
MTFGIVIDVPAPIEVYDAMHAELRRRVTGPVEGLLCHVARQTPAGFQVLEVWESREQYARYEAEVVGPTMAELSGGRRSPAPPLTEEFEPRGLVVPAAHVHS